MGNIEYLRKNCPKALTGFEKLTEGAILIKYHLSNIVEDGNDKLIDEVILYHVKQSIGESYEMGVKEMKKGGLL